MHLQTSRSLCEHALVLVLSSSFLLAHVSCLLSYIHQWLLNVSVCPAVTLQVLVLDLDETLLRTMPYRPEHMEAWSSGLGIMLKTTAGSDKLFTIPRANLLQFFRHIRNKYHIYFCTAGSHEYAREIMAVLQTHLVDQAGLTADEKGWILEHINER